MDALFGAILSSGTTIPFTGLIAFTILAIFRGWLVPGTIVTARIKDKDDQIERISGERDNWKTAFDQQAAANSELVKQNTALTESLERNKQLYDSLQNAFERYQGGPNRPTYTEPEQGRQIGN